MSNPAIQELPLVFDCAGATLLGIVHKPALPAELGVISIIAGGPQYRGGVGRGMVSMARELSANGVTVLRFDYRGMGDSEGEFVGFEDIEQDLAAAVAALRKEVPQIKKVVLWGGCDAASGAMIHAWKIPHVTSLVLGNPWVYTPQIESAVRRRHYLSRLADWSFWRKVLRLEYNLLDYARAGFARIGEKLRTMPGLGADSQTSESGRTGTFVDRMVDGLERFDGRVLFLMSGQSMLTREFDELVNSDPRWNKVYHRDGYKRVDFPTADQTFSTREAREDASRAILAWVTELQG